MSRLGLWVAVAALALATGCKKSESTAAGQPLRVGFFPNITHAQALVGSSDGTFQKALAGTGGVVTRQFNAGPAAMEALLAGSLDASYVGAGPAINAYIKTHGALRVIAGSASGGAVLVTRTAKSAAELKGKTLATPQLGNTQDIALRHWLKEQGLTATMGKGGSADVTLLAMSNADILGLMRRGELEGAWVPEPWGARLIAEAGGSILVDERTLWPNGQFPTTVLVASKAALEKRPDALKALVQAHVGLTARYEQDPAAFMAQANQAYGALTQHPLDPGQLKDAASRLKLTNDPLAAQLAQNARHAHELGFIPTEDLTGMVDLSLLQSLGAAPPKS